jgi:hypothetical protein
MIKREHEWVRVQVLTPNLISNLIKYFILFPSTLRNKQTSISSSPNSTHSQHKNKNFSQLAVWIVCNSSSSAQRPQDLPCPVQSGCKA